jgi:hypothetical protein
MPRPTREGPKIRAHCEGEGLGPPRPGGHKKRALFSPPLGRRFFVRIDLHLLGSPVIGALTNAEFRSWLALLSYIARFRGEADPANGEFPRQWARFVRYASRCKSGRVTPRQLERFIALGLLEELIDEDGKEWLRVVDWRDLHPLEWTGAIRARLDGAIDTPCTDVASAGPRTRGQRIANPRMHLR